MKARFQKFPGTGVSFACPYTPRSERNATSVRYHDANARSSRTDTVLNHLRPPLSRQNGQHAQGERPRPRLLAGLSLAALALLTPAFATAVGLGTVSRSPTIGSPLRIEIPLILGEEESLPQSGCAQISPLPGHHDPQFFPQEARVLVEMRGTPRILIVSSRAVTEPIVEFSVQLACSGGLARDYLLLAEPPAQRPMAEPASLPASIRQARPAETPTVKAAPRETAPQAAIPASEPKAERITLDADTTLNSMARKRFPGNRAMRDEYRRLIVAANREHFGDTLHPGAVPLQRGSVLVIPRSLPDSERIAAPRSVPEPAKPAPAPAMTEAASRKGRSDKLVIGDAPAGRVSPREALASVTRMEAMMEEQKQIESRIDENLRAVNAALIATRERFQELEAQQQKSTREQRDLRTRMETTDARLSQMPSLLELLVLVVGSGGVGAGLLLLHARISRPKTEAFAEDVPVPTLPALAPIASAAPKPSPPQPPAPVAAHPPATVMRAAAPTQTAAAPAAEHAKSTPPPPMAASVLDPPARATVPANIPRELEFALPAEPERKQAKPVLADLPTVAIGETLGLTGEKAARINKLLPSLPSLDVDAWFLAFDLLRGWSERKAFAALSLKMNEFINIEAPSWDPDLIAAGTSLTDLKRITEQLLLLWRTGDYSVTRAFLVDLLTDNRGGTRNGFPEGIAKDIAMLIGVIDILRQQDVAQQKLRQI